MATIAGVDVGAFALPQEDRRKQNISLGQAADGTFSKRVLRAPDEMFRIILKGKSTSTKNSLRTALEADADGNVSIDPDSGTDLGGGDGTAVNAQWVDPEFVAVKDNYESWTITMNFVRIS
jgi:hypothetical protein